MTATRTAVTDPPPTAPDRLRQLAATVRSLVPDRRRPEEFHETKDAIEHALRRLAAELER